MEKNSTSVNRRTFLALGAAAMTAATVPGAMAAESGVVKTGAFSKGFLWGAATAGHQVEGNNTQSDVWLLENVKPTMFSARSGDAANSFELWPDDLDLVKRLGLNSFRFSIEWARIEPESGEFSTAMLNHYLRIIEGCRARGLTPVVSFNHAAIPRWFAARGGWTQAEAPALFARYCDQAARHLAHGIGYATTLNEPNTVGMMAEFFPPEMMGAVQGMNAAAARACGSEKFRSGVIPDLADIEVTQAHMLAAHKAGRAAIKAVRGDLPVGVTLAISDDQAVGDNSVRDAKRKKFYGVWLDAARSDDFVGVQNYERSVWGDKGAIALPKEAARNGAGREIYAASLAGAVRYAHAATGVPVLITEHGLNTDDDRLRAEFIPAALAELQKVVAEGIPVKGYMHWSLLDNFEWIFGYHHHYGLAGVDRKTFKRTVKPSAAALTRIARRNAV